MSDITDRQTGRQHIIIFLEQLIFIHALFWLVCWKSVWFKILGISHNQLKAIKQQVTISLEKKFG